VAESDASTCDPDHIAAGGDAVDIPRGAEVRKASLCGKQKITLIPVAFLRSRPVAVLGAGSQVPFKIARAGMRVTASRPDLRVPSAFLVLTTGNARPARRVPALADTRPPRPYSSHPAPRTLLVTYPCGMPPESMN